MNKNTAASLVSGILAFIMMISISVLAMIICFALTLFNINYVTHKMDDRYFDSAINSLNSSLKNEIAPPSGFPEEVFDGLINKHLIKEDSVSAAKSLLLGIDYIYNSSRVRDIFITRFTQFAEDEGISFTKANLNSLTEYCLEEYERQINISFLKSFAPVRRIFDKYYTYGLLLFSALLITATLFLFKVNRFKHRAVRYCVYSLFASS